ncbi:MAG: DUF4168 domain-containing protein [Oscillatoriophycideae cyanobacterium NC_groundwater_1537_Pr4_S-0.65um_50_18]|nr:DUF4168 domain-containing protein [Oscillatoriophycideae cyanobacterium NC_groundwater_1537_Pr4_S-0.65um_50_18]
MMTALSLLPQLSSSCFKANRLIPGRPGSKRRVARSLWVGSFAAIGLLCGWVPSLQQHPVGALSEVSAASSVGLSFDNAAYAQAAITENEIQDYARSVLQIEPIRQAAYDNIKQTSGAEVPPILCHRPSSLNSLDPNIRSIAIDYCNQAIAIVESNNLTITRFNEITVAHKSDAGLAGRIQQAMAVIQGQ